MVYRKGERPVEKIERPYDPSHPVASAIADGDHWLDAWLGQMCTPWDMITRKTGISQERIEALTDDDMPTDAEIAALAKLWWTTAEGLRVSIAESLRARHGQTRTTVEHGS